MSVKKINGITKANVKKLNTIAKASVGKFNTIDAAQHAAIVSTGTDSNDMNRMAVMCYDTNVNRVVIAYQSRSDNHGDSRVGEVNADGTISWGSVQTDFDQGGTATGIKPLCMTFNPNTNKIHLVYNIWDADGATNYDLYQKIGTVTGGSTNTISWSPAGNLDGDDKGYMSGNGAIRAQAVYHADDTRVYMHYNRLGSGVIQSNVRFLTDDTTDPDMVQPGSDSDSQPFGTNVCQWTGIAYDSTNNKLLVATDDNGTSKIAYGTVDSTSGSESASWAITTIDTYSMDALQMAWDPNAEKGLLVWTDESPGHGKYQTFSISSGAVVMNTDNGDGDGSIGNFETGGSVDSMQVCYDSSAQHFVIVYRYDSKIYAKICKFNGSTTKLLWSSPSGFELNNDDPANDDNTRLLLFPRSSDTGTDLAQTAQLGYSPSHIQVVDYPDVTPGVLVYFTKQDSNSNNATGKVIRMAALGTHYSQTAG